MCHCSIRIYDLGFKKQIKCRLCSFLMGAGVSSGFSFLPSCLWIEEYEIMMNFEWQCITDFVLSRSGYMVHGWASLTQSCSEGLWRLSAEDDFYRRSKRSLWCGQLNFSHWWLAKDTPICSMLDLISLPKSRTVNNCQ